MQQVSIEGLNKVFDNRVRVGIMSALMANGTLSFNALKQILQLTDGNLASHLRALEENEYLSVEKTFVGRKTNTEYQLTTAGQQAFLQHIAALQHLISSF